MAEREVRSVEAKLGVRLPDSYRTFLLAYGQSSFNRHVVFNPILPLPGHTSETGKGHIDVFYGGSQEKHDPYSLAWNLNMFADRMPGFLIPIGGDIFGNKICLGVKGAETGKIYFCFQWLPEQGGIYLIADSFEDFLERQEISADE